MLCSPGLRLAFHHYCSADSSRTFRAHLSKFSSLCEHMAISNHCPHITQQRARSSSKPREGLNARKAVTGNRTAVFQYLASGSGAAAMMLYI